MKYKVGDIVFSTIWNKSVLIKDIRPNRFYLIADLEYLSRTMITYESNLKSREDDIEKDMEEYSKLCDEIMAIQGIEPVEVEMEQIIHCPEGYVFKDENGNVINATKIVLEKKKDVSLTQEQINMMVHDSCVLFCKHCGCGIPRETCTSLGTCKEHDEYRAAIRAHLMKEEKKEYPKTYEECCEILQYNKYLIVYPPFDADIPNYDALHLFDLLEALRKLIICRDAYWKLYGEEMGLVKPWKPDIATKCYVISKDNAYGWGSFHILEFPTREMRDAFYENFKDLIEECKELL